MYKFPKKENGQIMIIAVVFFICISAIVIFGLANPVVRHIAMATSIASSKESLYVAEAGIEDIIYRLKYNLPVSSSQTINLNGHTATILVEDSMDGKIITANGEANNYFRKIKTHLAFGTGISFHYGIQAGRGGFVLQNSSTVTGNVYSSGSVLGSGNIIDGDVVSSGDTGLIDGIHVKGSAYSHIIKNSNIDKDAYYTSINNSVVLGASHSGSPDQGHIDLPISDEQIGLWEAEAEAGGVINSSSCVGGFYEINSSATLGPVKINCGLIVKGNNAVLTMAGPIWVAGNIKTQTGSTIKIAPSLGSKNVALIADNPADKSGSGIVSIEQNSQFQGSGFPRSFVFIISQNNNAEMGGTTNAFNMGQSSGALVAYASHGLITLGQSVGIKEATAYKIILQNTANVTYDSGLPSSLFSTGPAGGYDIFSWKEIE